MTGNFLSRKGKETYFFFIFYFIFLKTKGQNEEPAYRWCHPVAETGETGRIAKIKKTNRANNGVQRLPPSGRT